MSCEQHLQTAVSQLADKEELKGHVVLILDKVSLFSFVFSLPFSDFGESVFVDKCLLLFVSIAVPAEVAMGEHLCFKISLCESDAFTALFNWIKRRKGGEIKCYTIFFTSLVSFL